LNLAGDKYQRKSTEDEPYDPMIYEKRRKGRNLETNRFLNENNYVVTDADIKKQNQREITNQKTDEDKDTIGLENDLGSSILKTLIIKITKLDICSFFDDVQIFFLNFRCDGPEVSNPYSSDLTADHQPVESINSIFLLNPDYIAGIKNFLAPLLN
jgi:hypothetical protein